MWKTRSKQRRFSNDKYDFVLKHLSSIWENDDVVFVNNEPFVDSPFGFSLEHKRFFLRAKELLSGGLGGISVIVCSSSGYSSSVIGSSSNRGLFINEKIIFVVEHK